MIGYNFSAVLRLLLMFPNVLGLSLEEITQLLTSRNWQYVYTSRHEHI